MVGNESPAFAAFRSEALARVERVFCAFIPSRLDTPTPSPDKLEATPLGRELVLDLPSTSPLACHTMILDAANRCGKISEFMLVFSPISLRSAIQDVSAADIDRLCDDFIKSWLFLAREAMALLRAQGMGKLCLVLTDEIVASVDDEQPDLAGPLLSAAFKALADSLLLQSGPNVPVLAFGDHEHSRTNTLAAYCFKILDEDRPVSAGKWHRAGRGGLFNPRKWNA